MGKRIIQQARGHGSHTYRVKKKAFKFKLQYPVGLKGEGQVIRLLNSAGHTAPVAKINSEKGVFHVAASKGLVEGQKINFTDNQIKLGNILELKDIPVKTSIHSIESRPRDGGIFIKSGGNSGVINRIIGESVYVILPSKKEKKFNQKCRAIIGVVAGSGRTDKPILKAGKQHHIKKSKSKLYPRTSAVKMNAIDHPFGSGRGKNPKSKIAKRNAPPGRKVGLIRPKRTGKRK